MIQKILFLLVTSLLLSGCSLPFLQGGKSALQITAGTPASVYLNGNHVGQTPFFDDNIKPGEYTIRLLVESDPSKDWQIKATLSPKIVTVIDRQFGAREDLSSYYLLQLEELADDTKNELSIITIPDTVIVKVDGQPRGFSPVSITDLTAGDHVISLAAPGYSEQNIPAQTRNGYKLIVTSQLAKTAGLDVPSVNDNMNEASPSADLTATTSANTRVTVSPSPLPKANATKTPSPSPTPKRTSSATASAEVAKPYVQINETGTGWLRVRDEPTTSGAEVARVDVGTKHPYLETTDDGWHKIEYESGKEGWVAGSYATVYK